MRIISGTRRGHKLIEFAGDDVRPTTDRVKESLFSIIQNNISDALVLDLFGGSGALSFEAISRGARGAVCVDIDRRSVDIIRKNMTSLGFDDKCVIVNKSCFDYMRSAGERKEKFDIIFLDPPYNKGFIEPVLADIVKYGLLNTGGIIVLESDNTDFYGDIDGLEIIKQRKYGRTYITVYGAKNENCGLSGKL